METYYKIVVYAPLTHADAVRAAMGGAGAGRIGAYTHCSFSQRGTGRYVPSGAANPFIGQAGVPEAVEEERVEMNCAKELLPAVLTAIKAAHPYEEIVMDIYESIDWKSL